MSDTPDSELRGWEAKISVNGTMFDVQSGDLDAQQSTARGDNTGVGPFQVNIPDKASATFNFVATRKADLNPHANPLAIMAAFDSEAGGGYRGEISAAFQYWPNGALVDDDTQSWRCAQALFTRYSERFSAEQGLNILTVNGVFSGEFFRPGDAGD